MVITIEFESLNTRHPNSDITIFELSKILEAKYGLIDIFCKMNATKITNELMPLVFKKKKAEIKRLIVGYESFIQNEWRQYINKQMHGIKTQLALKEGRESFIDTKAYYLSLKPRIKINYT